MKYGQKLPKKVEQDLDAYIERVKSVKWFKPDPSLSREKVDTQIHSTLKAFGIEASIEYRNLKTTEDWDAARSLARDAAWDAAWGACELLATHTKTYNMDTPFLKLFSLWEMGLYPYGVIGGKFVVYVPEGTKLLETGTSELPDTIEVNGVKYQRV